MALKVIWKTENNVVSLLDVQKEGYYAKNYYR